MNKIQNISLVKNRDNFSNKAKQEKIQNKIQQLEKQLAKLLEEKEEHEHTIEEIKKKSEDNYYKKIEIFKRTIKPIENSK